MQNNSYYIKINRKLEKLSKKLWIKKILVNFLHYFFRIFFLSKKWELHLIAINVDYCFNFFILKNLIQNHKLYKKKFENYFQNFWQNIARFTVVN